MFTLEITHFKVMKRSKFTLNIRLTTRSATGHQSPYCKAKKKKKIKPEFVQNAIENLTFIELTRCFNSSYPQPKTNEQTKSLTFIELPGYVKLRVAHNGHTEGDLSCFKAQILHVAMVIAEEEEGREVGHEA